MEPQQASDCMYNKNGHREAESSASAHDTVSEEEKTKFSDILLIERPGAAHSLVPCEDPLPIYQKRLQDRSLPSEPIRYSGHAVESSYLGFGI